MKKTFNKHRWEEDSPSGNLSFIWENIFPASEQQFSSYLGHWSVSQHLSSCPSPQMRPSFFSCNCCSCMPITRKDPLMLQPWAGSRSALGECGRGDETVTPFVYFVITEGEFPEPRLQVTHGYSFKKFGISSLPTATNWEKRQDKKGRWEGKTKNKTTDSFRKLREREFWSQLGDDKEFGPGDLRMWINVWCSDKISYQLLEGSPHVLAPLSIYILACSQSCPMLSSPTDCSSPGSSVMGFPRQEYWSGLSFAPPRDLLHPGIEPACLASPTLKGRFFNTVLLRKPPLHPYPIVPSPFDRWGHCGLQKWILA